MAGQIERYQPQFPKELDRYLIADEKIAFLTRRHWITLTPPFLPLIAGIAVVILLDQVLSGPALRLRDIAIVIWFGLLARFLYYVLQWWREFFLATNRRLMLVHGIFTRQVDIMPMTKVTDMRYDRSLTGQIFGYGVYILESAGQDQALSTINFVPHPDRHYKQISGVIFGPSSRRLSDKLVPGSTDSKLPIAEPEEAWWRRP